MLGRCSGCPEPGRCRAARGVGGAGLPAVLCSGDGISLPRVLHLSGSCRLSPRGQCRVPTGKRSDDSGRPDHLQAGGSAVSQLGSGGAALSAGCPGRVTVSRAGRRTRVRLLSRSSPGLPVSHHSIRFTEGSESSQRAQPGAVSS